LKVILNQTQTNKQTKSKINKYQQTLCKIDPNIGSNNKTESIHTLDLLRSLYSVQIETRKQEVFSSKHYVVDKMLIRNPNPNDSNMHGVRANIGFSK